MANYTKDPNGMPYVSFGGTISVNQSLAVRELSERTGKSKSLILREALDAYLSMNEVSRADEAAEARLEAVREALLGDSRSVEAPNTVRAPDYSHLSKETQAKLRELDGVSDTGC